MTTTIERPILFNGAMVRAILEGRKTQTRRVVKPQPAGKYLKSALDGEWLSKPFGGLVLPMIEDLPIECPYGQPGDRLWVRETWQGPLLDSEEHEAQFRDDGPEAFKKPGFCAYRATDTLDAVDVDGNELCWRPSIHMPRWASRILLEVVSVRVERLNDISESDCWAEGIEEVIHLFDAPSQAEMANRLGLCLEDAKPLYAQLWEFINGAGSWDENPWVWVVEFKRIEPPKGAEE